MVLNKIDLLDAPDLPRVVGFIQGNANALLGFMPDVFPVSARTAERVAATRDDHERDDLLKASGMPAFDHFLRETLDERGRLRLKLGNPLGIAGRLLVTYGDAAKRRETVLTEDQKAIDSMRLQIDGYMDDMRRDFAVRLDQIDAVVYEMDERADHYFDQKMRLARIFDLMNSEKMRADFDSQVVADTAARIDRLVQDLIDWMAEQELRVRQQLLAALNRRREAGATDRVPAGPDAEFGASRRELIGSVAHAARDLVNEYDRNQESVKLADSMRNAVTQTALVSAGALSLGTAIVIAIGTVAADVTGILAASVVAGLGLLIIPAKRRRARREFHQGTSELRLQLRDGLTEQFTRELGYSLDRVRSIVAPYDRFVRAETAQIAELAGQLKGLQDDAGRLRRAVELL